MSSLCFVGHRPESLPFGENEMDARCIRLKAMLLTEIMDRAATGYDTFLCGADRGMDIIFGRQVLLVKATTYPQIKLVCVVPHEEQAKGWPEKWRDRYFKLLEQADDMALISHSYTKDCCHKCKRRMVDTADTVLSVYNGSDAGETAYAVKYAHGQGKEIVVIHPLTMDRTVVLAKTTE